MRKRIKNHLERQEGGDDDTEKKKMFKWIGFVVIFKGASIYYVTDEGEGGE